MGFVPFSNTVLVHVRYTYQSQLCENTLYFSNGEGVNEGNMIALGEALSNEIATNHMPNLPNALICRELYLVDLSSETAPAVTVTAALPAVGGINTEPAPSNCSLTISFRSSGRGRSSRGRNYLLGLTENYVSNNQVSPYFTAVWSSFYQFCLDQTVAPDWVWVVASRVHNGAPRALGETHPVTAFTYTDLTVDSQRRRLPGRGR